MLFNLWYPSLDQWSPLSDNERKDSVSMNVEFVKFHLSRSRKVHLMSSGNNTFIFMDHGNTSSSSNNTGSGSSSSHQAAIRFSSKPHFLIHVAQCCVF